MLKSSCRLFPLFRAKLGSLLFNLLRPHGSSILNKDLAESRNNSLKWSGAILFSADWQLSSANSIKISMLEGYLWDIWHLHSAHFHSSYIEPNEHFLFMSTGFFFFPDLSGCVTYFLAEVMLSIYLLPSTHQLINIIGVAYGQKYTRKPTQVQLKQPQSEQVNRHYNPAPRERLRPAILFTDCVPLMEMCWLHRRSVDNFMFNASPSPSQRTI